MTTNPFQDGEGIIESELNSIVNGLNNEGVLSGGDTSKGTGNWDVDYTAVEATIGGTRVSASADTVTLSAADGTDPRIDLITIDNTGTVSATEGTAAATPTSPDIPSDEALLAVVTVRGGSTNLVGSDIRNRRIILPDESALSVSFVMESN